MRLSAITLGGHAPTDLGLEAALGKEELEEVDRRPPVWCYCRRHNAIYSTFRCEHCEAASDRNRVRRTT